ncbi:methyltransferase domain-containing protein [Streptomyces sp. URMC 129]|uniref:methyltransferase domain-containing protein n=1 Tax=Streptomyces sp. URMC 129 TaxID=3423407 RepID=UPI003F1CEC51
MTPDNGRDEALRAELTRTLTAAGHLRTGAWRNAVEAVPRHTFLGDGVFRRCGGGWEPVTAGHPDWLPLCYRDAPAVTRVAGIRADEVGSAIPRKPTHSCPAPGLAVRMLEEAGIEDGMRVLHIGTGTGYLTALLSHRLGDDRVTTVEINPDIAQRARKSLARAGYYPRVIAGDGVTGWPPGHRAPASWDRIISTCAVITVPSLWFGLIRPEGRIVTPLSGRLGATALARFTVGEGGPLSDPHVAIGRLIAPAGTDLPLARPQGPPPLGPLPDIGSAEERPALVVPADLGDPTARFVAQAAAPWIQHVGLPDGHLYWDPEAKVWAALRQDGEKWLVRQSAYPIWNRVEEQITRWRADSSPALHEFSVAATVDGHLVTMWDSDL